MKGCLNRECKLTTQLAQLAPTQVLECKDTSELPATPFILLEEISNCLLIFLSLTTSLCNIVNKSWGVFAVGLFANSRYLGIEVADGLFHGGGFRQLGIQCVEIVAIIAWSIATATLFFYVVGVALSRDLRNPRAGVRLEFPDEPDFPHKADPKIHGCMEDNIDMILIAI